MYNNGFDEKDLYFNPEYAQEILDEASNNEYVNLKEDIDTLMPMINTFSYVMIYG